jgi:hypothetical protein
LVEEVGRRLRYYRDNNEVLTVDLAKPEKRRILEWLEEGRAQEDNITIYGDDIEEVQCGVDELKAVAQKCCMHALRAALLA